jgi:hypothetical protein
MKGISSENIISQLQRRWNGRLIIAAWLFSLAIALAVTAVSRWLFHFTHWIVPVAAFIIPLLFYRRLKAKDIIIYLDTNTPGFEESTNLFTKDAENLNLLQRLQLQKISTAAGNMPQPPAVTKRLVVGLLGIVLAVFITAALSYLAPKQVAGSSGNNTSNIDRRPETKLPGIEKLNLTLTPPSYTGRKQRQQQRFNVTVEEGGHLYWNITTSGPVQKMQLVFNDRTELLLRSADSRHWSAGRTIDKPGFYQVKLDSTLSELYQLELIKDQPPVIAVQSPKPNTLIEPWMRTESQVSVNVSDDYGIGTAFIAATIASGSGEAVKFKQQQLPFPGFSAGNNQYRLQKLIDLKALGMKRGDELYFYISAADNHGQEKRSDMYIVRIEDTAQLLSIEGLASGLDIKPEFFRSQRQIIIETEQLLREKDTISVSEFNRRSNNLGIDQKLLRLRYSKFLGEEDSEGAHDDAGAFTSPEDFNNAGKILDEVTHKHDIAEDATFFDPETKKQLKATLAEMWKSELQLRTMKPKDALPFEYAALRLLKELQQSSRVYVAKTGVKTPPLKPEKRLTGDLDKISSFIQQQTYQPDQADIIARKGLGVLEQVRSGEALTADGRSILEQALIPLSQQAAAMPSVYLTALESLRRIIQQNQQARDIAVAGRGLQNMLRTADKTPYRANKAADGELSKRYFENLNKVHD